MSLVDQCSFVGLEGGDDLRNVDLDAGPSLPATSRKYLLFGRKLFQRGRPATQLIAVGRGDARRPQKANSPLSVANGKGERL